MKFQQLIKTKMLKKYRYHNKMLTIVSILKYISTINFSRVEHEKMLINSGPNHSIETIIGRVPTSSGNHGKPGKSQKNSMHGKTMEFEKN